jgi:hypothetical protein
MSVRSKHKRGGNDAAARLEAISQQIADTREVIEETEPHVAKRVKVTADLNLAVGIIARVRNALKADVDQNEQRRVG